MLRSVLFSMLILALPLTVAAERDLPRFGDEVWVVDDAPFLQSVAAGQSVRVRFPVGELDIEAADILEVRTELTTRCDVRLSETLCTKYRSRLRLEGEVIGDTVEVRLVGLPKWKLRKLRLDGRIVVPRWAPLAVRVGIGDVDIRPGDEDLAVTMGIGDLTIRVPEERVATVRLATRIGDASLRGAHLLEGNRRMLLGARVDWSRGSGPAAIAAGLKIGDAKVVLE